MAPRARNQSPAERAKVIVEKSPASASSTPSSTPSTQTPGSPAKGPPCPAKRIRPSSKLTAFGVVATLAAIASAVILPFWLPVPIPETLLNTLPNTQQSFYFAVIYSLFSLVAWIGSVFHSGKFLLPCSAVVSLIAILYASQVLIYYGVFLRTALRFLWNGIPSVLEHGLGHCTFVPRWEIFGYIINEGCHHRCDYGVGELAATCMNAALQAAIGNSINVTVPLRNETCMSSVAFAELNDFADAGESLLIRLMGCMGVVIISHLCAIAAAVAEFFVRGNV